MNYQSNLRDCQAWKDDGLELSTSSNEAAKLLDHALDQLFCHVPDPELGGILGTVNKMLEADQTFVLAKIFSIGVQGASCRNNKDIEKAVAELQAIDDSKFNPREFLHRKAVVEWAKEEKLDAMRTWEEILLEYPRDSMALLLSLYGYIISGQSRMLRDCIARILPSWRESDFHYGYLQGYYAFGLEQCHLYDKAEKIVLKSLERNKDNTWAMHAYSHIFDATSRCQEGVDFLNENDSFLSEENTLSCHLYWHQTVNQTELGNYGEVINIFDNKIRPTFKKTGNPFNINDGCQLLQRLEFEGIDVGDRWEDVYAAYKPIFGNHELLYDDAHLVASLIRSKSGREDKDTFMQSIEEYAKSCIGSNGIVTQNIGLNLCKGIFAYNEGYFEEAADHLFPIYKDLWNVGGSNAQRDLFDQFVFNSCIKSPLLRHRKMARSILNERKLLRPNSLVIDRAFRRLEAAH